MAIVPHFRAVEIKEICQHHPDIDIVSPICRWLYSNRTDDGTSRALQSRWQYPLGQVPEAFSFLDIWQTFRLPVLRCNQPGKEEYATVSCKPQSNSQPSKFSPVFVLTNPTVEGIHGEFDSPSSGSDVLICSIIGLRPAQVRLVFRERESQKSPNIQAPVCALVAWFTKLPRQRDRKTGMFKVSKELDMQGRQRCGIVGLSQIVALCPLSPVFDSPCEPSITALISLDTFSEFWVNHYASRDYFQLLR